MVSDRLRNNLFKLAGRHAEYLRLIRLRVLDHVNVGAHIRLGHARLGVQRGHDEQLQAEFLEQLQCVFGVLVVHLGEHLVNDDEMKPAARRAIQGNVVLVGDGGHEDGEGQLRLSAARLAGTVLIVAAFLAGRTIEFAGDEIEPAAHVGDFFLPPRFLAEPDNELFDAKIACLVGFQTFPRTSPRDIR